MAKVQRFIGFPGNTMEAFNNGEIKLEQMFKTDGLTVGDAVYLYVGGDYNYIKSIVEEVDGKLVFGQSFYIGELVSYNPETYKYNSPTPENTNLTGLKTAGNGCIIETELDTNTIIGYGDITKPVEIKIVPGQPATIDTPTILAQTLLGTQSNNVVDINDIEMIGEPAPGDMIYCIINPTKLNILHYCNIPGIGWRWCVETEKRGQTTYNSDPSVTSTSGGFRYLSAGGSPTFIIPAGK